MELTVTAGLVGSVQLLSACEAQFAVPFPLRSRLAPSFESQTLPTLAHPWVVALAATRVFGPRAHSIFGQPSSPWTNTSCQNEKKKKKKKQKKPSSRDFGGNHGNCLLCRITVTFSKSSLFHQLWDTLKFTEFLSVVLLSLGAKCFCGRNSSPIK